MLLPVKPPVQVRVPPVQALEVRTVELPEHILLLVTPIVGGEPITIGLQIIITAVRESLLTPFCVQTTS